MNYEINVSLNGEHLFATAERSLTNTEKAHKAFALFKAKFPASEGYSLMLTRTTVRGELVDKVDALEDPRERYRVLPNHTGAGWED